MTTERLKDWRAKSNMTQAKAASMLGVKVVTYKKWETGVNPIPEIAIKLIEALEGSKGCSGP